MFRDSIIRILLISLLVNVWVVDALEINDINENNWYSELIEGDNLEVINTERRFKWYKEIMVYSDEYYIEGLNPEAFPNKMDEDYFETEFSKWDHEFNPPKYIGRTIESRIVNKYRDLRPVRYLFFESFLSPNSFFVIDELEVLIDDQAINYIVTVENGNEGFNYFISNGIFGENKAYLNNDGKFMIDLGDYYGINQIKIALYIGSDNNVSSCFELYLNESSSLHLDNYGYYLFDSDMLVANDLGTNKYLLEPEQNWIINPVYQEWYYSDALLTNTYYRQRIVASEKRYKDILYRYSGIGRDYLDGYHLMFDDEQYQMDEELYQDFYQYRLLTTNQKIINNNFYEVIVNQDLETPIAVNNFSERNRDAKIIFDLENEEDDIIDEENSFCPFFFISEDNVTNKKENKGLHHLKKKNYLYMLSASLLLVFLFLLISKKTINLSLKK